MKKSIDIPELLLQEAGHAHRAGRLREARALYRRLLSLTPRAHEAHNNLGLVAFSLGVSAEAEMALRKAVELNPRSASYHANLAAVLHATGQMEAAARAAKRALALDAKLAPAHNTLGLALFAIGRDQESEAALKAAVSLDPRYAEARLSLALLYMRQSRLDEAETAAADAIRIRPKYLKAYGVLGDAYFGNAKYVGAAEVYRRALSLQGPNPDLRSKLGSALHSAGDLEGAREQLELAVKEGPDLAVTHTALGRHLQTTGDLEAAAGEFRTAIRLSSNSAAPLRMLATVVKHETEDDDVMAMEKAYHAAAPGSTDRMNLAYGLGKAREDLKDYQVAFDLFAEGGAIHRALHAYSEESEVRKFAGLRKAFSAELVAQRANEGHPTAAPVFIVGMPRSGTTLTEQIVASHPDVYGAGELSFLAGSVVELFHFSPVVDPMQIHDAAFNPRSAAEKYLSWMPEKAKGKQRFTDKMPHNFQLIGLIKIMFPNAKIVHVRRSPMDTCLSNFKNAFAAEGLNYSYDLGELGRYYNLYRGLMEHWEATLPAGAYYNLQYEDLVREPDTTSRALFDYLELEWSPDVLDFHTSKREIRTASLAQVRQPINVGSVNLSDRYGARLDPLREALAEWVEDDSARSGDA